MVLKVGTSSDYINYDLLDPFLPDNSFTIACTYDLQDLTSGVFGVTNYFFGLKANDTVNNYIYQNRNSNNNSYNVVRSGFSVSKGTEQTQQGLITQLVSFNLDVGGSFSFLMGDGGVFFGGDLGLFNNTGNTSVELLKSSVLNWISGENNPLFEFRLYNRSMNITEMQDLQTELNNKYI